MIDEGTFVGREIFPYLDELFSFCDKFLLDESIYIMTDRIKTILAGNNPTIYLFGSVVLNDFRFGWSDIDIIVLTDVSLNKRQVDELVTLRQTLTDEHNGNPYYRLFEGGILSKKAFLDKEKDIVVYWGTSGQRITDTYIIDSFATAELLDCGILLCGEDIRSSLAYPTHEQFKTDILRHYNTIRQYGKSTNQRVTSCGWILDIARGLYTLKTGKVIAKTAAGEWAVAKGLAPNSDILKRVVDIRKNPLKYKNDSETLEWCGTSGDYIQEFADVLERELME
jgi:predicted nucleotidyltransferase